MTATTAPDARPTLDDAIALVKSRRPNGQLTDDDKAQLEHDVESFIRDAIR